MIDTLSAEELDQLEAILGKPLDEKTELQLAEDDYSLEDHCKLYLLGLPNKLGPLGFLA